ncbi:hypothetical protein Taro_022815 [Colocasia esculenta]|uniref:Uncharacterized protein n=1 Tax=Colocasia esculenta TaxID=4460 RepID=A0A843V2K7_COLES|nr:hypothetical protein [Colocasia esculenta]
MLSITTESKSSGSFNLSGSIRRQLAAPINMASPVNESDLGRRILGDPNPDPKRLDPNPT